MTILGKVKNIIDTYNPFSINRRKRMREKLMNRNITLLTPNCLGGILFHDLGLKFMSPTVNLMMTQTDFVKFVTKLDDYVKENLIFFIHSEFTCPCARLKDITIHFTHYLSEDEARRKWNERVNRIQKNNLFIFCMERDGLTEEHIRSLAKVEARGIVVFTANKYDDIPYAVHIPKYKEIGEIGNVLAKNHFDGSREYEQYFDFVKWFNEANANGYDVTDYLKM